MSEQERRAPVLGGPGGESGTISWAEHMEAFDSYKPHDWGLSAAEIADLGGFTYQGLTDLLGHEPTTWRAEP